ncbi:uncharacterized protein CTRU02_214319 [Colletotrichum truncatum]|uniref:Uncharacterized protein n=1 Tax=Colletotrichum truncatum TaxID=5467 RepID=A0ACC3YI55_COLTU
MGSASSKQAENESNSKELEWIKSALIALSRTSKQLLAKCNRRDKKTDYLRNIETSSWILKQRLSQISRTDIEHSMETINKLTQCLDTIFNIVQKADQTDEAAVHQDRRRNQIQDMIKERTPWDHSLVERLSFSLSNAVSCWYNLQLTMERLTDEFERDNHMTDEIENLKISKDLQAPDEDSCQFLDKVFSAAQCTCHGSAERDLRLRLGTYRRRGKKPNLTSLCILLGRDIETGPLMRWHELDISTGSRVE